MTLPVEVGLVATKHILLWFAQRAIAVETRLLPKIGRWRLMAALAESDDSGQAKLIASRVTDTGSRRGCWP